MLGLLMNLENINIEKLPIDVRKTFKRYQVMHAEKQIQNRAKNDFLSFVKCVWPDFIEGSHHRHISKKFNDLATGKLKRLIVNMPPRHTKSEFASYLLPAWMVGRNPKLKIIQATHTGELAIRFGRKIKHLIDSQNIIKFFTQNYRKIQKLPEGGRLPKAESTLPLVLAEQSRAVVRIYWSLMTRTRNKMPLSDTKMESAYEWYTSGPRQRLQPGASIVLVMTRWSLKDLTGMLLKHQKDVKADQWEIVEFPAIMDDGEPMWPEYWKKEELLKAKATLPITKWNAQFMQRPTSEEGAIIKREWWRKWKNDWIPIFTMLYSPTILPI